MAQGSQGGIQLHKLGDLTQGYELTKLLGHDGIGEVLSGLEPISPPE